MIFVGETKFIFLLNFAQRMTTAGVSCHAYFLTQRVLTVLIFTLFYTGNDRVRASRRRHSLREEAESKLNKLKYQKKKQNKRYVHTI